MTQVVKSLEAKVEELKSLESTAIELQAKVTQLEAKVEQQDSLLSSFLREKNERTAATDFISVPIINNQSAVAINGLPSSCADLKMIGHIWSGFYFVMGLAKMESVYCDFTKLPDDAGKFLDSHELFSCNYLILLLMKRFSEMDRIRRRQIGARPFLRPEKFAI
jgi:hypothetical protein